MPNVASAPLHLFFSEKHVVVDDVCGKSRCVEEGFGSSPRLNDKIRLPQILDVYAIATCATHAFADSQRTHTTCNR